MYFVNGLALRFFLIFTLIDCTLAKTLACANSHAGSNIKVNALLLSQETGKGNPNNSSKLEQSGIFTRKLEDGTYTLTYYGLMLSGAVARSVSATAVHPLNVIKTMLQKKDGKMPAFTWKAMTRGAGSQFIMSIPHGAMSFAVTETTKKKLAEATNKLEFSKRIPKHILNPSLDMLSSAISTFICSIISTPQMVVTDRIMAEHYANFFDAVYNIFFEQGWAGFYLGWLPAICQKIPSYALTWMFFQQLKQLFLITYNRPGTNVENTMLGSFAAAGACCLMIPIDTVKTRIVTQGTGPKVYKNMIHCLLKIIREEGVGSLYRALPPRLLSVVPMTAITFAVYEWMKRLLLHQPKPLPRRRLESESSGASTGKLANTAVCSAPLAK